MKLTLGKAAKEAGISKPSLSAAIKKGRLSAQKNESGVYEIDPAELFRVYPKKSKANPLGNGKDLPETNIKNTVSLEGKGGVLNLLLAERDKLLAEKDKSIALLKEEKDALRADLEDQKAQSKRITLLLEDKSSESSGVGTIQKTLSTLESRIKKQEQVANEEVEKQKKLLEEEKERSEKAITESRDYQKTTKLLYIVTGIIVLTLVIGAMISYQDIPSFISR